MLASLAESHEISRALEEMALGLERIAARGTLASILILDELSDGRLRHGAAPSLPRSYVALIDGQPMGPSAGSCGTAAFRGATVIVTDIATDPLWEKYRDAALSAGLRACWSVPIRDSHDDVLGTFAFYYREPRAPAPEDLVAIDGAARLARLVLERERADGARMRANMRERAQFAAARVLAEAERVPHALTELIGAIASALSWHAGSVWLREPDGTLACNAHWSCDPQRFAPFFADTLARRIARGEGLPGRVYESSEAEWLATSSEASGFLRWQSAAAVGIHQGLAFPIVGTCEPIGVIELFATSCQRLDRELLVTLRTVGMQVGQFLLQAEAQDARQRLIEELRETVRFRDLFAGILAHDLRNPLSTLMAGIQVLVRGCDPRARVVLGHMQSSAVRMTRMIEQLLDVNRSRAGDGLPLARGNVMLGELASSIASELTLAFPTTRIDTQIEGDTRGYWDRDRLAQVLSNLLGNAIDHSEPGGVVTVRIDGRDSSEVTLRTHNTGTVPAETLPTLFDPFKCVLRSTPARGLGLGLYITKQIVAAHGGQIDVESDARGTHFQVRLPRMV